MTKEETVIIFCPQCKAEYESYVQYCFLCVHTQPEVVHDMPVRTIAKVDLAGDATPDIRPEKKKKQRK